MHCGDVRAALGSARNPSRGESDGATQKVGGKTTYFLRSVPLCAIITVEAGGSQGERGRENRA